MLYTNENKNKHVNQDSHIAFLSVLLSYFFENTLLNFGFLSEEDLWLHQI